MGIYPDIYEKLLQLREDLNDANRADKVKIRENLKNQIKTLKYTIVRLYFFPYIDHLDTLVQKHINSKLQDLFENLGTIEDDTINLLLDLDIPEKLKYLSNIEASSLLPNFFEQLKLSIDKIEKIIKYLNLSRGNDFQDYFKQKINRAYKILPENTSFSNQENIYTPAEYTLRLVNIFNKAYLESIKSNYIASEFDDHDDLDHDDLQSSSIAIPQKDKMILNLMWIKKTQDYDSNSFVFPKEYTRFQREINDTVKQDIFDLLDEWAENFPIVIFWYDSTLISSGSLERTQKAIQERCKNASKIQLRDVRDLDIVKELKVFQHPKFNTIPVYVRSDWFRLLVSYEQALNPQNWLQNNKNNNIYSIYADLSLTPFLPELISGGVPDSLEIKNMKNLIRSNWFKDNAYDVNLKSLMALYRYGFALSRTTGGLFENGAHIFTHNDVMLNLMKLVYIDGFSKVVEDFLNKKGPFSDSHSKLSDNIIYESLWNFSLLVLQEQEQDGVLFFNDKSFDIDQPINVYEWFFGNFDNYMGQFKSKYKKIQRYDNREEYLIPTFPFALPESNHV